MSNASITRRVAIAAAMAGSAAAAWPALAAGDATAVPTRPVDTTSGKVRGLDSGGISRFFGIPYGTETGRRRFQPAHVREPWAGIRDCNELGAKTLQGPITISGVMNHMSGQAKALPIVMKVVFEHGGRIELEPEKERTHRGACFRVLIPLSKGAP